MACSVSRGDMTETLVVEVSTSLDTDDPRRSVGSVSFPAGCAPRTCGARLVADLRPKAGTWHGAAEAELFPAGPAGSRAPAEERDAGPGRGGLRCLGGNGPVVRGRDRRGPGRRGTGSVEVLVGLGRGDVVIVDGTLIPADRITADKPYHAQKRKQHGGAVQVIATCPDTIGGTTGTMPVRALPANAPSPASSNGDRSGEHAARPVASAASSPPPTPSCPARAQDERGPPRSFSVAAPG